MINIQNIQECKKIQHKNHATKYDILGPSVSLSELKSAFPHKFSLLLLDSIATTTSPRPFSR